MQETIDNDLVNVQICNNIVEYLIIIDKTKIESSMYIIR